MIFDEGQGKRAPRMTFDVRWQRFV